MTKPRVVVVDAERESPEIAPVDPTTLVGETWPRSWAGSDVRRTGRRPRGRARAPVGGQPGKDPRPRGGGAGRARGRRRQPARRPPDRGAEAHTLAGLLGPYGRPGSALFAEVERVLDDGEGAGGGEPEPESDLGSCAERVRRALAVLG